MSRDQGSHKKNSQNSQNSRDNTDPAPLDAAHDLFDSLQAIRNQSSNTNEPPMKPLSLPFELPGGAIRWIAGGTALLALLGLIVMLAIQDPAEPDSPIDEASTGMKLQSNVAQKKPAAPLPKTITSAPAGGSTSPASQTARESPSRSISGFEDAPVYESPSYSDPYPVDPPPSDPNPPNEENLAPPPPEFIPPESGIE